MSEQAESRRAIAHRANLSAHEIAERSRNGIRQRMAELSQRLRTPAYNGRELDLVELDRLWRQASRWP